MTAVSGAAASMVFGCVLTRMPSATVPHEKPGHIHAAQVQTATGRTDARTHPRSHTASEDRHSTAGHCRVLRFIRTAHVERQASRAGRCCEDGEDARTVARCYPRPQR